MSGIRKFENVGSFEEVYDSFKNEKSDKHVRQRDGQTTLYSHKKFDNPFTGSEKKKWANGSQFVKDVITRQYGPGVANMIFDDINKTLKGKHDSKVHKGQDRNINEELLRSDLDKIKKELRQYQARVPDTMQIGKVGYQFYDRDEDKLGNGGNANVYVARSDYEEGVQLYAVKRSFDIGPDEDYRKNMGEVFEREAETFVQVMKDMSNVSNIVLLKDVYKAPDGVCEGIITEYMQGGDVHRLAEKLRTTAGNSSSSKGENPALRLTVLRDMAMGLSQVHKRGVIHCDVKLGNFLVSGTGTIKVTDFGESTFGSRPVGGGFVPGSPPPEMTRSFGKPLDQTELTSAYDIFCLGQTYLELCCDSKAFTAGTVALQVLRDPKSTPAQQDQAFKQLKFRGTEAERDLILRMIDADPKKRPTAEEVSREVARLDKNVGTPETRKQLAGLALS